MKCVAKADVLEMIERHKQSGEHVDDRVFIAVCKASALFLLQLKDKASFLSLIWQQTDQCRLLTPPGCSRTLNDVARRFVEDGYTFDKLTAPLGLPRCQHHPEWFEPCRRIDNTFEFRRFGLITIVQATDSERQHSPSGSFYIHDGVHKTLVLSTRLLLGKVVFEPVEALLVLPKPG